MPGPRYSAAESLKFFESPGFDLKYVDNSFLKQLVVDPSCFWREETIRFLLGIRDDFKCTFVVPNKIMDIIEGNRYDRFAAFMNEFWEGRQEPLESAWGFLYNHRNELELKRASREIDFPELQSALQQDFPDEGSVLYDILQSSYQERAFIIGFGHSDPPFWKKLWNKTGGKLVFFGGRLGARIKGFHDWKNAKIRPRTEKNRLLFSAAGGAIGYVIGIGSGGVVPKEATGFMGTLVIAAIEH